MQVQIDFKEKTITTIGRCSLKELTTYLSANLLNWEDYDIVASKELDQWQPYRPLPLGPIQPSPVSPGYPTSPYWWSDMHDDSITKQKFNITCYGDPMSIEATTGSDGKLPYKTHRGSIRSVATLN